MNDLDLARRLRRMHRTVIMLQTELRHDHMDEELIAEIDRQMERGIATEHRCAQLPAAVDVLRREILRAGTQERTFGMDRYAWLSGGYIVQRGTHPGLALMGTFSFHSSKQCESTLLVLAVLFLGLRATTQGQHVHHPCGCRVACGAGQYRYLCAGV